MEATRFQLNRPPTIEALTREGETSRRGCDLGVGGDSRSYLSCWEELNRVF